MGCSKAAEVRGLCAAHGGRRYCKVEACTKTRAKQGMCKRHFRQVQEEQEEEEEEEEVEDTRPPKRRRTPDGYISLKGAVIPTFKDCLMCPEPALYEPGLCEEHSKVRQFWHCTYGDRTCPNPTTRFGMLFCAEHT